MSEVFEGLIGVNMESSYVEGERRIKFEDNPTWYGAPAKLHEKLGRGWKVKVKVEQEGRNTMIVGVKVIEKSAPKAKSGGFKGGGGGGKKGGMSKEEWAAKDLTIRYQHCQKEGHQILALLIETGSIVIPKKKGEAVLMGHYDRIVASLFADISGQLAVKRVAGESDEPTDVDFDDLEDEATSSSDDEFGDDDDDEFDD